MALFLLLSIGFASLAGCVSSSVRATDWAETGSGYNGSDLPITAEHTLGKRSNTILPIDGGDGVTTWPRLDAVYPSLYKDNKAKAGVRAIRYCYENSQVAQAALPYILNAMAMWTPATRSSTLRFMTDQSCDERHEVPCLCQEGVTAWDSLRIVDMDPRNSRQQAQYKRAPGSSDEASTLNAVATEDAGIQGLGQLGPQPNENTNAFNAQNTAATEDQQGAALMEGMPEWYRNPVVDPSGETLHCRPPPGEKVPMPAFPRPEGPPNIPASRWFNHPTPPHLGGPIDDGTVDKRISFSGTVGYSSFNYLVFHPGALASNSAFVLSQTVHELGHVIGFNHEHQRPDAVAEEWIEFDCDELPGAENARQAVEKSQDEFFAGMNPEERWRKVCSHYKLAEIYFPDAIDYVPGRIPQGQSVAWTTTAYDYLSMMQYPSLPLKWAIRASSRGSMVGQPVKYALLKHPKRLIGDESNLLQMGGSADFSKQAISLLDIVGVARMYQLPYPGVINALLSLQETGWKPTKVKIGVFETIVSPAETPTLPPIQRMPYPKPAESSEDAAEVSTKKVGENEA